MDLGVFRYHVLRIGSGFCPWVIVLGFRSDSQGLRYSSVFFCYSKYREDTDWLYFSVTRFILRKLCFGVMPYQLQSGEAVDCA